MPRICVYLSDHTMEKLEVLAAKNDGKTSKTIEKLIMNANPENSENIPKDISEIMRKLRIIENDTNKKVQILIELMNSFINTFGTFSAEDFTSSSVNPHPWLSSAEETIIQKIELLQQEKFMNGGR